MAPRPPFHMQRLLTTGDAAKVLGLSAERVRQLGESGGTSGGFWALRTKGGQRLFLEQDVLAEKQARRRNAS